MLSEPRTSADLAAQESAAARDLDPCADMSALAWLHEERG